MASGQNTGGSSRRRVVRASSGGGSGRSVAVKQLLTRLRCTWRRQNPPRRAASVSFGYDLHSYSQNFDDGHHRL
ncbi:hypothetical protein PVAP13_5KG683514 [Panicum virgatum]|uniref:Uncharacterized protein n=1 Tax=Panicum virgatum TaxID=38727 RepID=A0A8T0SZM6_PANVG|nr:hypothetical protein PVAP13_5KG683514 [Panicum virgatum]